MKTVHLQHKHGGRITAIIAVAHSTHEKVADWFYRGDVEWRHGGKSVGTAIPPWAVCFDQANTAASEEYATISEALNTYLVEHGKWHDTKHMKDGRAVSWTPKKKAFAVSL